MSKKIQGNARNAWGHTKESIGNTLRIGSLQRSGLRSEAKGNVEKNGGGAANYAGGTKDRAVGRWKSTIGALTGNKSMEAKGHMTSAKGEARQKANKHH
ncbi:hypothetical protein DL96DRAFT_1631715 [Flagelloscypha sp. PMI_526]|nr:hypothetical protein DL96DRAFT_1631715 [Flagelloscypha sp. PMI_526]